MKKLNEYITEKLKSAVLENSNEYYNDNYYNDILDELADEVGYSMTDDIEGYTYEWLDEKFKSNKSKINKFEHELNDGYSKTLDELTEYLINEFGNPNTDVFGEAITCFCYRWIKENK